MKMNNSMAVLLKHAEITTPFSDRLSSNALTSDRFILVNDCLLLREQYEKSMHVRLSDFPDRTGFECFINHIHLTFDGSEQSLKSCLHYANALAKGLTTFAIGRRFFVIMSLSDNCVVRFHQCRANENWVAADLESYSEEAVLTFPVEGSGG